MTPDEEVTRDIDKLIALERYQAQRETEERIIKYLRNEGNTMIGSGDSRVEADGWGLLEAAQRIDDGAHNET